MTSSTRSASRPPGSPSGSPSRRPVVPAGPRRAAKVAELRRRRRATARRRAVWAAAALVPLALLAWLVFASPVLALGRVQVTGTARLTPEQVRAAAALVPGTPMARLDPAAVARRVERLAPVASASVSRSFPHALRIHVVERTAVAGVRSPGGVRLLDRTGVPFAGATALPAGAVLLEVARPGPADTATRAALAVLADLPPAVRSQLASVAAPAADAVQLRLRDGRSVVWGAAQDDARKAAATLALLRLPGHVYDVSAPGVVTRR